MPGTAADGRSQIGSQRADRRSDLQSNAVSVGNKRNELHLDAKRNKGNALARLPRTSASPTAPETRHQLESGGLAIQGHKVLLGERAGQIEIPQGLDRQRHFAVVDNGRAGCPPISWAVDPIPVTVVGIRPPVVLVNTAVPAAFSTLKSPARCCAPLSG